MINKRSYAQYLFGGLRLLGVYEGYIRKFLFMSNVFIGKYSPLWSVYLYIFYLKVSFCKMGKYGHRCLIMATIFLDILSLCNLCLMYEVSFIKCMLLQSFHELAQKKWFDHIFFILLRKCRNLLISVYMGLVWYPPGVCLESSPS